MIYNAAVEACPMTLSICQDPVPISIDTDGVARVGGTRVTLDTVIGAFRLGACAEEIVLRYDALSLADVCAAIAFYLKHPAEINDYLRKRDLEAEEIRRTNDAQL